MILLPPPGSMGMGVRKCKTGALERGQPGTMGLGQSKSIDELVSKQARAAAAEPSPTKSNELATSEREKVSSEAAVEATQRPFPSTFVDEAVEGATSKVPEMSFFENRIFSSLASTFAGFDGALYANCRYGHCWKKRARRSGI